MKIGHFLHFIWINYVVATSCSLPPLKIFSSSYFGDSQPLLLGSSFLNQPCSASSSASHRLGRALGPKCSRPRTPQSTCPEWSRTVGNRTHCKGNGSVSEQIITGHPRLTHSHLPKPVGSKRTKAWAAVKMCQGETETGGGHGHGGPTGRDRRGGEEGHGYGDPLGRD